MRPTRRGRAREPLGRNRLVRHQRPRATQLPRGRPATHRTPKSARQATPPQRPRNHRPTHHRAMTMTSQTFSQLLDHANARRAARLEALWRMTPDERIDAMRRGDLTLEQCCAWQPATQSKCHSCTASSNSSPPSPPRPANDHPRRPRLLHHARHRTPRLAQTRSAHPMLRPTRRPHPQRPITLLLGQPRLRRLEPRMRRTRRRVRRRTRRRTLAAISDAAHAGPRARGATYASSPALPDKAVSGPDHAANS